MTTRLEDLTRLREVLWLSIVDADPDKRAPLAARIESVVEQIEKLSPKESAGDSVDEIARRRAARRSGPAEGAGRAKRSG